MALGRDKVSAARQRTGCMRSVTKGAGALTPSFHAIGMQRRVLCCSSKSPLVQST